MGEIHLPYVSARVVSLSGNLFPICPLDLSLTARAHFRFLFYIHWICYSQLKFISYICPPDLSFLAEIRFPHMSPRFVILLRNQLNVPWIYHPSRKLISCIRSPDLSYISTGFVNFRNDSSPIEHVHWLCHTKQRLISHLVHVLWICHLWHLSHFPHVYRSLPTEVSQ